MEPPLKKMINANRGSTVVRTIGDPNTPVRDTQPEIIVASEPEQNADQALAVRVARVEAVVAALREWADAASLAESVLQRDSYMNKAYERAAARRDAARKAMLAIE